MLLITYANSDVFPSMREEDIRMLDVVNIFSMSIQPDGTAFFPQEPDFSCIPRFRAINPNIKFVIMLGYCQNCSDAFLRKSGRERFANTLMDILRKYDLDGLDNDWEIPTYTLGDVKGRPEDRLNYTMVMRLIRQRMDEEEARTGRHYLLTCAQSADRFIEETIEIPKLVPLLDYINVMTYDMRGVHAFFEMKDELALPAGHHTCTYPSAGDTEGVCAQRAVELFRAMGVPDEKIVIGSGLYPKHFTDVPARDFGLMQPSSCIEVYFLDETCGERLMPFSRLQTYIKPDEYVRHWDDDAKACWLYNEKKQDFVTYEDEESLYWKVDYVKKEGLLGLMFYEYAYDDLHTLIPAAWQAAREN